jgi:ATP-dependent Clp protease adaptor protein ClpS
MRQAGRAALVVRRAGGPAAPGGQPHQADQTGELMWKGPIARPQTDWQVPRTPMTLILDQQTTIEHTLVNDADVDAFFDTEDLWAIIVWNDDVTTFQTVIQAFVEIFHHSYERADQLAWTIHRTGKAVAAIRPKEEAEAAVRDLHRRKISASLARA